MPYDEALAERIREQLQDRPDVAEKKMLWWSMFHDIESHVLRNSEGYIDGSRRA